MNLVLRIPDSLADRLTAEGGDLERRALEAFLVEEYRSGRMTKRELRQALGFETRTALDGVLKAHEVYEPYSMADIELERLTADRLGL